ncbi:hypothetical protein [Luteibacter yeojuensis]|uniref:Uncharacterized protein n=1 Tax=Luteibacter yeojuensis TaxID=345309 RepID=A0A7X5QXG8_9GAMM|nr:hypothetical protein [Luteibacter yeojuensis]NID17228.1 hypothetical protein [Luteibacter yeojuensis]
MDKLLTALKNAVRGLPYLTLLTAILYMAGREFNTNYWRSIGLPLMATEHSFADMLYDGFLGFFMWSGSLFGSRFDPLRTILVVSLIIVAIYRLIEFVAEKAQRWAVRHRANAQGPLIGPRVTKTLDELTKWAGYFIAVYVPLLLIPVLVGITALTPILPSLGIGEEGWEEGRREFVRFEARVRQLRDGLVDVSVVDIRRADDGKPMPAIPIECAGDRCAAMTESGPVSLPKDRFGEERLVRSATWDESCLSSKALAKRRSR